MGNVVLIGYRGSGKTTVGRLVADRLGYEFVDTDVLVAERAGKTIAAIFAEDGEAVFRSLEAEVIAEASARSRIVLSAGGGAILRDDNVRRLRECGTVFWLTADARVLWSRIQGDVTSAANRPALTSRVDLDEVRHVLGIRYARYEKCAHQRIDTTSLTPVQVAEAIVLRDA
ncbi:MAG: shikimate kinase [Phycisphaerae bacterium]|nr:shikimate kinase [Phycisphaerae bacterium]